MLNWLSGRAQKRRNAKQLYGAVVTWARSPELFADIQVADTREGRYEALVLALFLVLERLRGQGAEATAGSQRLIEAFVEDMDDHMREMGVGDLSVPRKVKKAAAALYDRAEVYRAAFHAPDEQALAQAFLAHVPAAEGEILAAEALARWARDKARLLSALTTEDVLAARWVRPQS